MVDYRSRTAVQVTGRCCRAFVRCNRGSDMTVDQKYMTDQKVGVTGTVPAGKEAAAQVAAANMEASIYMSPPDRLVTAGGAATGGKGLS